MKTKTAMESFQVVVEKRAVLEDVGMVPKAKMVEYLIRYDLNELSLDRFFLVSLNLK